MAAWAGVAPGNGESAKGQQRSGKTRKEAIARFRAMLTQLAHAAYVRTKGTHYLSAFYQRLAVRRGKRAIIALAHSIMGRVFSMLLSRHEAYRERGANYF